MARQVGHVAKQLQRCVRSLDSFTAGQVCMVDCDWDQMTFVTFQVAPNDGLYKGAAFEFKVSFGEHYPHLAPTVNCLTPIYHPNIDSYDDNGNVCVSLLDEWTESNTLDDVIQALLFLMYNPDVDDPMFELTLGINHEDFEQKAKTIYADKKNPFSDEAQYDIEDDDFFHPAFEEFKATSREAWEKTASQRNAEWLKVMEEKAFVDKITKWEIEKDKEKKRREEEEKRHREEVERRLKEEEQRRVDEKLLSYLGAWHKFTWLHVVLAGVMISVVCMSKVL